MTCSNFVKRVWGEVGGLISRTRTCVYEYDNVCGCGERKNIMIDIFNQDEAKEGPYQSRTLLGLWICVL